MNPKDKALLNILQFDFPLVERPFQAIGYELGWSEREVISRVKNLKKRGLIRRIGGVFEAAKLKYRSVLVAAQLPQRKIARAEQALSRFPEITHGYLRSHAYNFWFTITAASRHRIQEIGRQLAAELGLMEMRYVPALKRFKVDTKFRI